jgi:hypothetical protein
MGLTASLGVSFSDTAQQCYQGSLAETCVWDDAACHVVWTQQQMVKQVSSLTLIVFPGGTWIEKLLTDFTFV